MGRHVSLLSSEVTLPLRLNPLRECLSLIRQVTIEFDRRVRVFPNSKWTFSSQKGALT